MPSRNRLILSTIFAGIVTPVLAMFLDLAGSALYQGDLSALTYFPVSMLPTAAVFGAPLAIPVALAVRLRNPWRAVPFIAVAAAFGIELQEAISQVFEDSNTVSVALMLVWIGPAILGTAAALLFKWRERTLSVAIAAIAAAAVIAFAINGARNIRELAPAHAAAESWSKLRVGMNVFLGDEGNASGQTVCPTLATILADQSPNSCRHVAFGAPAIVDAIIPCKKTDPGWGYESPHVRLHALDGSWAGFASAGMLQPTIPVGTLVEMQRDWGAPLSIYNERDGRINVGGSAMVRVLRYDPTKEASLYVKILDGAHRDQIGWMGIEGADTGGVALGAYALQYDYKPCMKE